MQNVEKYTKILMNDSGGSDSWDIDVCRKILIKNKIDYWDVFYVLVDA